MCRLRYYCNVALLLTRTGRPTYATKLLVIISPVGGEVGLAQLCCEPIVKPQRVNAVCVWGRPFRHFKVICNDVDDDEEEEIVLINFRLHTTEVLRPS